MSAANDNTGELAWSIPDAAQAMGISKATVWRHIAAGNITTFKIGCRTLIRADVLKAFVDLHSNAA